MLGQVKTKLAQQINVGQVKLTEEVLSQCWVRIRIYKMQVIEEVVGINTIPTDDMIIVNVTTLSFFVEHCYRFLTPQFLEGELFNIYCCVFLNCTTTNKTFDIFVTLTQTGGVFNI